MDARWGEPDRYSNWEIRFASEEIRVGTSARPTIAASLALPQAIRLIALSRKASMNSSPTNGRTIDGPPAAVDTRY